MQWFIGLFAIIGLGVTMSVADKALGRRIPANVWRPIELTLGVAYSAFIAYGIVAFFAGWWPY